jgi:hypothetical protein
VVTEGDSGAAPQKVQAAHTMSALIMRTFSFFIPQLFIALSFVFDYTAY